MFTMKETIWFRYDNTAIFNNEKNETVKYKPIKL